jgi:spore maturation protein CgeB
VEGLVAQYLADPAARQQIAEAGFRHVRAHHSYDHRARQMLDVLRRTSPRGAR